MPALRQHTLERAEGVSQALAVADVFTKRKRSEVMARIRAKGTKPEVAIARALRDLGIRFNRHAKDLPGRPDFALSAIRTIINVKGCFWHGHFCLKGRVPEGNRPYWRAKIAGNRRRDRRNEARLRRAGWRVLTVWECRVRKSTRESLADTVGKRLRAVP